MKFKTVTYSALVNLGNYNNEKIGFTVDVEENESVEQIVESLRQRVREIGGQDADEMYRRISENRYALRELERKIKEAEIKWNATAEFLRAQGLKPEAPDLPQFVNLLPKVESEHTKVIEGEITDSF